MKKTTLRSQLLKNGFKTTDIKDEYYKTDYNESIDEEKEMVVRLLSNGKVETSCTFVNEETGMVDYIKHSFTCLKAYEYLCDKYWMDYDYSI